MPNIPYKSEKSPEDDEDYEIVSFEDFCDKSRGSKTDLLTLNDNINYRLCYEIDKGSKFEYEGEGSSKDPALTETSLGGVKNAPFKGKAPGAFAPFGRSNGKSQKGSLFGGVIPKQRVDGEGGSGSREHRYQRFSSARSWRQRFCDNWPVLWANMLGVALVCALCVAVWWAVCGAIGGVWGDEHYRKLWERAHPDNIKKPLSPVIFEKPPVIPEYRYHDHNNLSTKNKNATLESKKKDFNKKSFADLNVSAEVCADVTDLMRFDCGPQQNETVCLKRGCCWKETNIKNAPYCFYPPNYNLFRFVNMTENKHGMRVMYMKARDSGYPGDFEMAIMDVKYMSDDTLHIKIYDANNKRFEVSIPDIPTVAGPISKLKYRVQIDSATIGFKIIRNSDNVTVINTSNVGAMILSDKFLQLSAILSADQIFGFGEHKAHLRRNMDWNTLTMWNRDRPPQYGENQYGTHPFYIGVEKNGMSHGMLLHNSNAMDVTLQPTPAVTYRTVGGVLSAYIFLGPTPKHVAAQYTAVIGRPFMPPYWALGFQLCKFGYETLNETQRVWKMNRDAGVPFDVQWNDIDAMHNYNDFTYDPVRYKGLPEFVKKVHAAGMHYVFMFDPGVGGGEKPGTYPPFDRGMEMDVFVKNATNQPFEGSVWQEVTLFPDFTHPNATAYWKEMFSDFHDKVPFDGAWLDMNEPSNHISGQRHGPCGLQDIPYTPKAISSMGLRDYTLCMDAKHHAGLHYDIHNLYALYEIITTNFVLQEVRGKRAFIISRASFAGLGRFAGHWGGDVASNWDDYRMSMPEILSFSLFGVAMTGSDICGFSGNADADLCKRWMQLGAFYPFSRNHADRASRAQDPASMGGEVLQASIKALRLRYNLLPYYYTAFWRAHVDGDTVARPLFFENPEDLTLRDIDSQFLIGSYIMITPILQANTTTVRAYYPGPDKWYNIRNGEFLASNEYKNVTDEQMVSVKGGAIIPLQQPPLSGPVTTTNSRSGPMQLLVVPDDSNTAYGQLYWDDGDSQNSYQEKKYSNIEFTLKNEELRSRVIWWGYGVPSLNNITVCTQSVPVGKVFVNGNTADFVSKKNVLEIYNLNLSLDAPFTVKWVYLTKFRKYSNKVNNDTVAWWSLDSPDLI